ncbi:MAG: hypothetical protein L3J22_11370, partial [Xanthomonadales bacterium]|nr:hypothetical protein [Xanthomonadales bacterium]
AGDMQFRAKVKQRMEGLVESSRGLVLATHNTNLMQSLCTKGLVLSKGKMIFYGELDEALDLYKQQQKTL